MAKIALTILEKLQKLLFGLEVFMKSAKWPNSVQVKGYQSFHLEQELD